MRQHLIEKRNQRSMQIDEDRKYLARVADRDGQEQHLKMRSSEVLKNEFLFFNDQKQLENKLKREQEREEYQKSKLDYFPFVSGELLEQHRQGLSGQMRADLQNYLIAKSQGLVGSGDSRKHATPNRSSAASSVFKAMSDGSLDGRSDRLTKASTSIVKALHDSCYQVPEKNPRVIQDTDPVKNEAWRAALARHESEVAQQKQFNEVVMKKHYEKVAGDDAQVAHENDDRKRKQKRFFEEIRTQIDSNAVRRDADDAEARRLVPTSFGPSEDEDVVMKQRMIVDKQKRNQKQDLSQQIEAKKQQNELTRRTKIEGEQSEANENQAALRAASDRKVQDRREAKQFWHDQLERTGQQRKLGKDADDVLKKPVAA